MTDNRTNEPKQTKTKSSQDFVFTEAQVEAAAKAIADCHNPGMFERYPENWRVEARAALEASNAVVTKEAHDVGMDAVDWDMVRDGVGDPQEAASIAVRAALVAAQGATPSVGIRALAEAEVRKSAAEGNPICEPGVTKDIAFIRGAVFGAAQGDAPHDPGRILLRHPDGTPKTRTEIRAEAKAMREGDEPQADSDCWHEANFSCAPVLPSTDSLLATFADWHERWWRNEPDTIQKANAQAAFFAGWDAHGAVSELPSSTVDEDALADVLTDHVLMEPNGGTSSWSWCKCSCGFEVRREGVTRDYVEKLARKHQARAVVEAIGGESRAARE